MALLEINKLNVAYGDVHVLFDLDISVEEGEIVSIIGGNGAGKSTLLKTISGLLKPLSGTIGFQGKEIKECPPTTSWTSD